MESGHSNLHGGGALALSRRLLEVRELGLGRGGGVVTHLIICSFSKLSFSFEPGTVLGWVMNKMDVVWLPQNLHARGGRALMNKMDITRRLELGGSGRLPGGGDI